MYKNKKVTKKFKFLFLFTFLLIVLFSDVWQQRVQAYKGNDSDYTSLEEVIKKMENEFLNQQDYSFIMSQTGLGKEAVKQLILEHRIEDIYLYQYHFLNQRSWKKEKINPITFEEIICDQEGKGQKGFRFASIKNGDILITQSTSTLGWHHGHAAIVVDAKNGLVLEAMTLGENSAIQPIEKWMNFTKVIQLRVREEEKGGKDVGQKAAVFASKNMKEVPYRLFAGFPKKEASLADISGTQCAHLVWISYYNTGYDLDQNGGWLVIPKDIVKSPLLEIVQIYGVSPEDIWQ